MFGANMKIPKKKNGNKKKIYSVLKRNNSPLSSLAKSKPATKALAVNCKNSMISGAAVSSFLGNTIKILQCKIKE
jgi:hypothetical protein